MYHVLKLGNEELKLRLRTQDIIGLEKSLGGNPLDMFMAIDSQGKLPTVTDCLKTITYSAQKFHHGLNFSKVQAMYDDYVDEGKDYTDLIPEIMEIFKVSGFIKGDKKKEETSQLTVMKPQEEQKKEPSIED